MYTQAYIYAQISNIIYHVFNSECRITYFFFYFKSPKKIKTGIKWPMNHWYVLNKPININMINSVKWIWICNYIDTIKYILYRIYITCSTYNDARFYTYMLFLSLNCYCCYFYGYYLHYFYFYRHYLYCCYLYIHYIYHLFFMFCVCNILKPYHPHYVS